MPPGYFISPSSFESEIGERRLGTLPQRMVWKTSVLVESISLVRSMRGRCSHIKIYGTISKYRLSKSIVGGGQKLVVVLKLLAVSYNAIGILQIGLCLFTSTKGIDIQIALSPQEVFHLSIIVRSKFFVSDTGLKLNFLSPSGI